MAKGENPLSKAPKTQIHHLTIDYQEYSFPIDSLKQISYNNTKFLDAKFLLLRAANLEFQKGHINIGLREMKRRRALHMTANEIGAVVIKLGGELT